MPPLSYPDRITYYGFCRTIHPWFAKWSNARLIDTNKATDIAKRIKRMRNPNEAENPEDINEKQMAKAEKLESELEENALWSASIVLSYDVSDYFGNARPYDCEGIFEPLFAGINLYKEDTTMFYAVFEGVEAVEQREAYRELSKHPNFEDDQEDFSRIEKVFEAMEFNGKPEDWTLIAICRSYDLHF